MSSYKDFMRAKQASSLAGDDEAVSTLALRPAVPHAIDFPTHTPAFEDCGEGVYTPLQRGLCSHGLNARGDRPRLGLKWPDRSRLSALPRVAGAQNVSRFEVTDGAEGSVEEDGIDEAGIILPRLAIALMVRAAPPIVVDGFIRYHLSIGFEKIWMYFDAPHEDEDAIAVAEDAARHTNGAVVVTRCTAAWWEGLRKGTPPSRFLMRGLHAKAREEEDEATGGKMDVKDRFYMFMTERRMVDSLETGDVQGRQSVVVDLALCDAQREGLDWCFHIDVDELFYLPAARHRSDARKFFHERIPAGADQVRFVNLEIVPETLRVGDWFGECDLFKINKLHVRGVKGGACEQFRAKRRKDRRKRRERMGPPGDFDVLQQGAVNPAHSPEALVPEPFTEITDRIGAARLPTARDLLAAGVELPAPTLRPRDNTARSLGEMLEDGADAEEDFSKAWARAKARAAKAKDLPPPPPRPEPAEEENRWEPRPDPDYDPRFDHIAEYFNAYENGKSACRLRPYPARVPLAGVHGFIGTDGASSTGMDTADLRHAPVILHYANCGFEYWKRKYQVLGDFPTPDENGDPDDRPGMVNNMRSHLASRELVVRLDEAPTTGMAVEASNLLERFYKTWVAMSEHGERPYLAAYGLLERVPFPARLLEARRAKTAPKWPRVKRPAVAPPVPPKPTYGILDRAPSAPKNVRKTQWRVVYDGGKARLVSRVRPTIKAAPAGSHKIGDLVWGSRVTPDGFLVLSDPPFQEFSYLLVDATHLGHGVLIERVIPPILDDGACEKCFRCPCYCALLDSYGL